MQGEFNSEFRSDKNNILFQSKKIKKLNFHIKWRLDSNIESKSLNNTYSNIIEILFLL